MYAILFPQTGEKMRAESAREAWHCGHSAARDYQRRGAGLLGYEIISEETGLVLYIAPYGVELTLEAAGPSVRAFNAARWALLRAEWYRPGENTFGELKELAEEGGLRNCPNAGTKTYEELFALIWRYAGWSKELARELEICMSSLGTVGQQWLANCKKEGRWG